ncbi:hypothetical protein METBIDRAFT_139213 [Metschnikowia bicuspidata var. bicuspidata NRRL YB-4993]|uniref:Uncharacterized protein n=1 Tax=Metschnikowia bicuspidata var. bicuspidata NRRL YB-4993 TaxID=869754 RepID=A0A1A0HDA3_9ASCO|nr:hypothetical protein METBIDRAFT_139213 [Metschnikowia bicuspidata var. bicuspidata NRRL YB-4993]OBA21877.1 hypothetical protein METBIDRAFT_139213 [Metschnikowia bicuspidata var. bicuspidata NRRL YB-4993]
MPPTSVSRRAPSGAEPRNRLAGGYRPPLVLNTPLPEKYGDLGVVMMLPRHILKDAGKIPQLAAQTILGEGRKKGSGRSCAAQMAHGWNRDGRRRTPVHLRPGLNLRNIGAARRNMLVLESCGQPHAINAFNFFFLSFFIDAIRCVFARCWPGSSLHGR